MKHTVAGACRRRAWMARMQAGETLLPMHARTWVSGPVSHLLRRGFGLASSSNPRSEIYYPLPERVNQQGRSTKVRRNWGRTTVLYRRCCQASNAST